MRFVLLVTAMLLAGCQTVVGPEYGWMPPKPGWSVAQFERDNVECLTTAEGGQVLAGPGTQYGTYATAYNLAAAERAKRVDYDKCMYAKGYWLKRIERIPGS